LRKVSNEETQAGVRPFWSGTISFGLVSVPVNLFPATRDSKVSLRMLGPDDQPLKRGFYSPEGGQEVESSETVRGFVTEKGKTITVTEEELERLAPDKSRDINLQLFVRREELSPLYFNKAYFLMPGDKSMKAYRLLAQTMEDSGRAGIATFVMRGREYLVAILAEKEILRAETLRFSDEIRKPTALGLPKKVKPSPTLVRKFEDAIAKNAKRTLDLSEMRDEYAERMLKLIEKKSRQGKDVVESEIPASHPRPGKVVDLMEVLKKSLNQGRRS
jgi:DNA end-binding protein Ku